MVVPNEDNESTTNDKRARVQTRTLGVLVAVMVVAGVVALLLTVFGGNSDDSQAAGQPAGSQVGDQKSSSVTGPSTSAAPVISSAATSTTPTSTTPTSTTPTTSAPKISTPKAKATKTTGSASPATKIVKYTVKKGDNLTVISAWFNQRGVSPVYDWNKSVIGKNPNLIYPGQTIIVSLNGDHMKVSTKTK